MVEGELLAVGPGSPCLLGAGLRSFIGVINTSLFSNLFPEWILRARELVNQTHSFACGIPGAVQESPPLSLLPAWPTPSLPGIYFLSLNKTNYRFRHKIVPDMHVSGESLSHFSPTGVRRQGKTGIFGGQNPHCLLLSPSIPVGVSFLPVYFAEGRDLCNHHDRWY